MYTFSRIVYRYVYLISISIGNFFHGRNKTHHLSYTAIRFSVELIHLSVVFHLNSHASTGNTDEKYYEIFHTFKACVCYFSSNFSFFHQMIPLQKLWKMFFISSKKLFSFSRYSHFRNFSPSFPHFPDSEGQMEVE